MILLWIFCILAGTLLGLRFQVLILVPATALCIVLVLIVALSSGTDALWTTVITVLAAALLQVGYLAGIALNLVFAATDLRTLHHPPKTAIAHRRRLTL
jgi:hypothetical protein